jgi:zinc protease
MRFTYSYKFNCKPLMAAALAASLSGGSVLATPPKKAAIVQKEAGTSNETGFKLPAYEKVVLNNGLTVYLMEQHEVPLIYVSAVFPAGAMKDAGKSGLASITAESLLFGTRSYTKAELEEAFDFLGSSVSVDASQEMASLNASFMASHQDKVLPMIKEIIVDPVFNGDEFSKKQTRLLVQLDQLRESPRNVIGTYFNKFIFDQHPYGNPQSGTKASVSKLTVDDAKAFYKVNYVPNGSAIAVVGDFKAKDMKAKLQKLFKDWKKGAAEGANLKVNEPAPLAGNRVLLVNKDDAKETTFFIGAKGISRDNPDYVGIQVINTILGGRFTSWLNDELRVNSGLTYGARSSFNPLSKAGTFAISTFTQTSTTTEAIDLALQVLDRLHTKGIDETTLASAKNYVKGQFPPRYETAGSQADLLTSMYWYGYDESFINNFQRNVDGVTAEKAKEIVDKYFPKSNLQFVMIGKASEIRDKVKRYGPVTEKEVTADEF